MGTKKFSIQLLATLFDGFISFFPYRLEGRVFHFSTPKLLVYNALLCWFTINTALSILFIPVPQKAVYNKATFFFSSLAHNVSLCVCFFGVVCQRKSINLPFLHFDFAIAYLRVAGLNVKIQFPFYFRLGSFLVPMLVVLPYALFQDLDTLRAVMLLTEYLMVFFYYQSFFRTLGFLKVLENALLFSKNSLEILGDGIQYLGKMDKIESLIYGFNHLCSSCMLLNEVFSLNILTTVSIAFIGITISVYLTMIIFHTQLSAELMYQITVCNCLDVITYSILTWYLVYVCTSCVEEVKEFNGLVYQLLIDDTTNEILLNPKLRLYILMKREVAFTAYSFFNIDYTLIHSMFAAASTYLVILIQFSPILVVNNASTVQPYLENSTEIPIFFINNTTY